MSILYLILAAAGLGVLIFIHELGHYWVARHVGITVEAFSIGFGKAIIKWEHDGVEWRVGWMPFGGYVRMKGMETKGEGEPHEVEGGYFAARPIDRIKVALAGPIVNLVFAFLVFTIIWAAGGRDKPFSEFTQRIGNVDRSSELFVAGVRPGDLIESYDDHPVLKSRDHLQAPLLGGDTLEVRGKHVDYETGVQTPFDITAAVYPHPGDILGRGIMTLGVLQPAQYLIYDQENPLPAGSAMEGSGIESGDRILWVDGELIFSAGQLNEILNEQRALLTVVRGGEQFLARVPRLPINDMMIDRADRAEFQDWHIDLGLNGRVGQTTFIPYIVSDEGVVEYQVTPFDEELEATLFSDAVPLDAPLESGDRIIAVDGQAVSKGSQIMHYLQDHQVHVVVQREPKAWTKVSAEDADQAFDRLVVWSDVESITQSIGDKQQVTRSGSMVLLNPISPIPALELAKAGGYERLSAEKRSEIADIPDPRLRQDKLKRLTAEERSLKLGLPLRDRIVQYNPLPTTLYAEVVVETGRTFGSLISGDLSPKWLSGPVGIVTIMHHGWMLGIKEALFWLGVISLNLGMLNLLPIPVLDGGQVCFALWEWVTRKPIKAKTMERLVLPFVILIVGFFLFVTFHDISNLFRR